MGRGGAKLKQAIDWLGLRVQGEVAADFGCNVGGFTDCLLKEGARRVYAVDTGYGALAWKLRQDARVVVMERTNAMHVALPEPADLIASDVAWTRQRHILPNALRQAAAEGVVLSLFKPQYEAPAPLVRRGRIRPEDMEAILAAVLAELTEMGIAVAEVIPLPQERSGKNPEAFLYIRRRDCDVRDAPAVPERV